MCNFNVATVVPVQWLARKCLIAALVLIWNLFGH
jgi:hypothetical protein